MIKDFDKRHITDAVALEELCFSEPWSEKAFQDSISSPFSYFKVWEEEKVDGYIGLYAVSGEGSITNVAVHPEKRGQGIGEKLVREAIRVGRELNLEYITLEVRESNVPARRLYEKCGFEEMGKRKSFYSKPREDAVVMNYFFDKDR